MKIEYKAYKVVILATSMAFGYDLISGAIITHLGLADELGGAQFKSTVQKFFLIVFFGPILETFIFQVAPYYLLKIFLEKVKYFDWIYIIIAGLLFASSHKYSQYYIIDMILPGMFLCFMFVYLKKRFNYPIIYVIIIHSLHNSLSLIYDYFT